VNVSATWSHELKENGRPKASSSAGNINSFTYSSRTSLTFGVVI